MSVWQNVPLVLCGPGGKVKPRFKHQETVLNDTRDREAFAVFWEQGTGKTRLALDTMVHLAQQDKIDAMLILAPNGVHQLWIDDEIPEWVGTGDGLYTAFWTSSKAGTQRHAHMIEESMSAPFSIMAMGYEGFMTKKGKAWARKFLTKRKVLFVLDESTAIKTPSIKRTKSVVAAGKYAPYRRILTGTPVTNGPFDVYTQMRFLNPTFWKENGFASYSAFKTYFGIWETGYNHTQGQQYDHVVGYRNLDVLHKLLEPWSSRVLKCDVLDLPEKLYSKRYFQLTPEQRRIYQNLKDEAMTVLATGDLVTVQNVLVRLLRLHQVTSNYLPSEDDDEPAVILDARCNPRMDCFKETVAEMHGQALVWARFNMDVDMIMAHLGDRAVQCDGRVAPAERAKHIQRFKDGEVQILVSKPQTKGVSRGQTLLCPNVIYYNNTFSLEDRLQSEDRPHRAGQKQDVHYIDIVAPNTVDVPIVNALRSKLNIASAITGDQLKEWL